MSEHLIATIRNYSQPLQPQATDVLPQLSPLPAIRAVLFDIYGTLLISASGEVGSAGDPGQDAAFAAALQAVGLQLRCGERAGRQRLQEQIAASHRQARGQGIQQPEIDIVQIWTQVLTALRADRLLSAPAGPAVDVRQLAVEYECRVNPCWPMPQAAECLAQLQAAGRLLGVVSNAQFFTPLLFPAFFGQDLQALGIEPQMQYFSYRYGYAKPDWRLFQPALCELARRGVAPSEVLFVGNDMRNDVWAATQVGWRTALFAGDQRSLRLRQQDPPVRQVRPDLIVTELSQLVECVVQTNR